MFRKIGVAIVILAIAVFGTGRILAEDSPVTNISCTAVIVTGAAISIGPTAMHWTLPLVVNPADEGVYIPQDSVPVTGYLTWRFASNHRALVKASFSNSLIDGIDYPIAYLLAKLKWSVSGVSSSPTDPPLAIVDQAPALETGNELWCSVMPIGCLSNFTFTMKMKNSAGNRGGIGTFTLGFIVMDIV